jgi:transposase-like protein
MEPCGHTPVWKGQRVERTNARGRHTYVPEFKRWIVEQAQRPGMSVAGLALSNQVNANQLRRWIQLHGAAGATLSTPRAALLPVTVVTQPAPKPPPLVPNAAIKIEVADAVVRVHDGTTATTLRMVLACLRGTAP